MKPVFFTIADKKNEKYAEMMIASLKKFHPDVDIRFIRDDKIKSYNDPAFFYRAAPTIACELFDEGYDVVVKLDADQIITGNLDHILHANNVDVGVVYNWNRVDPRIYGEIGLMTINPQMYVNCGLVAMYNPEFAKHWLKLCRSPHFDFMPFREQGFLNILVYYNNYRVYFLDEWQPKLEHVAWHGLRSKGEWHRCELRKGKLILPKADDKYPPEDVEIKVLHWAGGEAPNKLNYRIFFNEECIKWLDGLVERTK